MDEATLREWLTERVAELAHIDRESVDDERVLASFGIDSADLVSVSADLERLIGRPVDPTIVLEYPTIRELAAHILSEPTEPAALDASGRINEPLAVVGIGIRVPGARGPDEYWKLLAAGTDAVVDVPPERWEGVGTEAFESSTEDAPGSRRAGLLDDIRTFDAAFFGITRAEALRMDPQQRVLLELVVESLEDAGIPLDRLAGTSAGVFVGASTVEYGAKQLGDISSVDGLVPTGAALSIIANRVSYALDLRGPSVTVDTACSSSLVALHLARRAMLAGDCDLTIVGGVNLLIGPAVGIAMGRGGFLAPDGRCKPFDERANGYVRGEGCGVVVLKRLNRAVADGDRVYAVVKGSAVNQDGRSNGLTAPNPAAQVAVVAAACADAGIDPATVGLVECHGTGTASGDAAEAQALGRSVGSATGRSEPCAISSVKSNIGHLEAAAGIAGFVKTCLSIHHRELIPTIHIENPNPRIPFDDLGLTLVRERRPWKAEERVAGVSSFGFGGTNAHVILKGYEQRDAGRAPHQPVVVPLSGPTHDTLADLRTRWTDWIVDAEVSASDAAWTVSTRRAAGVFRVAAAGLDRCDLADALRTAPIQEVARGDEPPRIAFVFSGQGGMWAGMAADLFDDELFASVVDQCEEAVAQHGAGISRVLRAVVPLGDDHALAQVCQFAYQAGVTTLLRSWGIVPFVVIGHSLGELAAAHSADVLTLAEGARLAWERGGACEDARGQGRLLLVSGPEAAVQEILDDQPSVEVAARNAPGMLVLGGADALLGEIRAHAIASGLFSQFVPVDFPSHTTAMGIHAERMMSLPPLSPAAARVPLVSTVTADYVAGAEMDLGYWANNLTHQVKFAEALDRVIDDVDIVVEIGPHPVLLPAIADAVGQRGEQPTLSSGHRDVSGALALRHVAARLWERGTPVRWDRVNPPAAVTSTPLHPWHYERYWSVPDSAPSPTRSLLGTRIALAHGAAVWQSSIGLQRQPELGDHRVNALAVVPAAGIIAMIASAAAEIGLGDLVAIRDLELRAMLPVTEESRRVQTTAVPTGERFRVFVHSASAVQDDWKLHAEATLEFLSEDTSGEAAPGVQDQRAGEAVTSGELYERLQTAGLEYGPSFRTVVAAVRGHGWARGTLRRPPREPRGLDEKALDGAFHLAALALDDGADAVAGAVRVPRRIEEAVVALNRGAVRSASVWVRESGGSLPQIDVRASDSEGRPVVTVRGLELAPMSRASSRRSLNEGPFVYTCGWTPKAAPDAGRVSGGWVVAGTDDDLAQRVVARLEREGAAAVRSRDDAARAWEEDVRRLDRDLGVRGVVFVGPTSADDAVTGTADLVSVLRRLAFAPLGAAPPLWVVTEGAWRVRSGDRSDSPEGAALWGVARTVPFEIPGQAIRCVDLDAEGGDAGLDALLVELAAPAQESEVALRAGGRWVPRITRRESLALVDPMPTKADGVYLITGGLGGLGLTVGRFLVDSGASHLVLVGRSAPSGDQLEAVAELRRGGSRVDVVLADVADAVALRKALNDVADVSLVRGIVHAAGVLDDRALLDLDAEAIRKVMAPKLLGALVIEELASLCAPDWVVAFSSAAGVLGSPGQANYCAANTFLDAWVWRLRERGIRSLAIDWGPWAAVGLVAARVASQESPALVTGLDPVAALGVMHELLVADDTQAMVLPYDLPSLLQYHPGGPALAPFADLLSEARDAVALLATRQVASRRPKLDVPYVEPRTDIERRIATACEAALGIAGIGVLDGFFQLGGDSVVANQVIGELNRILGVSIDPEAVFEDLTVARLAVAAEREMLAAVESMSDEQAAQLLDDGG